MMEFAQEGQRLHASQIKSREFIGMVTTLTDTMKIGFRDESRGKVMTKKTHANGFIFFSITPVRGWTII